MRLRTSHGSATPMVSAKAISATPASAAALTMLITWSSETSPSKGQPKATEIVTVIGGPPSALWRAAIACIAAICSAAEAPWLRMPKPSVAQTTTLASSQFAATQRSQPRSLRTSPMRERSVEGASAAEISSAPAICGTRLGFTKETVSIRRAGSLKLVDEFQLLVDVQEGLFVLQTVSGAHLDDFDMTSHWSGAWGEFGVAS